MWIKWKYNDHGHPDFRELEIPDDLDGHSSVEDWICGHDLVPTWSERFTESRIKWEKLELSEKEVTTRKVAKLKASIVYHRRELEIAQRLLEAIPKI
jgi:hypothetical protein